jgi:hypothetical protein
MALGHGGGRAEARCSEEVVALGVEEVGAGRGQRWWRVGAGACE